MRYQVDAAKYRMADRMREAEQARVAQVAAEAGKAEARTRPRRLGVGVVLAGLVGLMRSRRLARA